MQDWLLAPGCPPYLQVSLYILPPAPQYSCPCDTHSTLYQAQGDFPENSTGESIPSD